MCTVKAGCGSTTVDINKMEAGKFFFFFWVRSWEVFWWQKRLTCWFAMTLLEHCCRDIFGFISSIGEVWSLKTDQKSETGFPAVC